MWIMEIDSAKSRRRKMESWRFYLGKRTDMGGEPIWGKKEREEWSYLILQVLIVSVPWSDFRYWLVRAYLDNLAISQPVVDLAG